MKRLLRISRKFHQKELPKEVQPVKSVKFNKTHLYRLGGVVGIACFCALVNNSDELRKLLFIEYHILRHKLTDGIGLEREQVLSQTSSQARYPSLRVYADAVEGPIGVTSKMSFLSRELDAAFCYENGFITIYSGSIPERICVIVYRGDIPSIIRKSGKEPTNLLKLALVDTRDAKEVHQLLTSGIDLICLSDDIIVQNGINTIPTLVAKLDKLHKRRNFE